MTIREKIQRKENIVADLKDLKDRLGVCNIKAARMLIHKYNMSPSHIIKINYES
jgi:hypothetical protein